MSSSRCSMRLILSTNGPTSGGALTSSPDGQAAVTENGVIRVMSNPGYSQTLRLTPSDLISRLKLFAGQTDHQFWPDDVTLKDGALFVAERMHSSRQLKLTDIYLLGLAVAHGGRLATFDQGIPLSAVSNAAAVNLHVL